MNKSKKILIIEEDDNEIIDTNVKQTKGLKRNTIDKYYTKKEIVNMCLDNIKKYIKINKDDLIVEPSAGNGSFIDGIKELSNSYLFYDLEPENSQIIKQDFIEFNYKEIQNKYKNIHIIGNPPFGRQSSLAIKFIKKSCEFSNTISFILPKSFKKDSLKKTFPLNFHLIFEKDIPEKSFLVNGVEHDVPCVFQIWEKKINNRTENNKLLPNGFLFVEKHENPDISFQRVGSKAGKVDTNYIEKSIQSHYFIKFNNNKSIHENIDKISQIKYNFNNTVGPKSISKQELIKEFNSLLND
jgi:predicted RNA methylase